MITTDPIADMLTRIRNALVTKSETVNIPASNMKRNIANILVNEGFIKGVEEFKENGKAMLRITLKYSTDSQRVISGLKRISRPGLRIYAGKDELPRVLGGMGIAIISTSQGLMTDRQARQKGVGGEVLAYIW